MRISTFLFLAGCAGAPPAPTATPAASGPATTWAAVPLAAGAVSSAHAAADGPPAFRNAAGAIACPVMGMSIETPDKAVSYADHDGTRYYFCCDSCEKLFLDAPTTYADGKYLHDHALDPTADPSCGEAEG